MADTVALEDGRTASVLVEWGSATQVTNAGIR
jgi:hypothetical protein